MIREEILTKRLEFKINYIYIYIYSREYLHWYLLMNRQLLSATLKKLNIFN